MKDFIFNPLLPYNLKAEGTIDTLRQFNSDFKTANKLFYPSAGSDTTDLEYVNKKALSELKDISPTIFIHSDYGTSFKYLFESSGTFIYPNFSILSSFYLWGDAEKSIKILKLSSVGSEQHIWLLYFEGYFNEEILKFLIQKQIQIDIVYAVCDGITHGMGGCNREAVPTILYPFLAEHLNLKYIITEQSYEGYVKKNLEFGNSSKRFRRWFKNIDLIVADYSLKSIQELEDIDFIQKIQQILSDIPETKINSLRKARIYDHRFSHLFVLKQLFKVHDPFDDFLKELLGEV